MIPKSEKPTVIIDMDEVLALLFPVWIRTLEERHLVSIDLRSLKTWNTHEHIPELEPHHVYEVLDEPNLYNRLPVKRGAKKGLKYINDNYDTIIVSAAPEDSPYAYWDKKVWLREHFPFIDTSRQYFTTRDKTRFMKPGDVLIDDGVHNLVAHDEKGGFSICMAYPHNEHYEGIRVDGWNDVLHHLEIYTQQYLKERGISEREMYVKLSKEGREQRYK